MTDKPLSFADFEKMKPGEVSILHYNLYNKGTFVWVHSHVGETDDTRRAYGQFAYSGDVLVPEVDGYLYESDCNGGFGPVMCRGSGAEPVFSDSKILDMDPRFDDDGDMDEY